ncbi:MAG: clostripain-related cysteine peptidase [Melioribacteraceae bacterium]|nr:clostripain-related cysteine peptidase [Melioribacteraceae bacterium]
MKRIMLSILLIIIGLMFYFCKKESNPVGTENENAALPKKEWTFLFYDDADFYNAYDPFDDFSELVSSNQNINYLVLRDRNDSPASYYKIGENHEQIILKSVGEVNMASQNALQDFIEYGKKYFPAERFILALYDHGGGWVGACIDLNGTDILSPAEMNNAVTNAGGIDIILFTAPCLMGSLETAYQLRNSTKYYIGSEENSGFIFWLGMLNKFDSFIKNSFRVTNEVLAQNIIALHNEYKDIYGWGYLITMSAVRSSKLSDLVSSLKKVTDYYLENPSNFKVTSMESVRRYSSSKNFIDLLGILEVLDNTETEFRIKNYLRETINIFSETIVAECHGDSTNGSNGLNIYYPLKKNSPELYYLPAGFGLHFKNNCSWENLLNLTLGKHGFEIKDEIHNSISTLNGKFPR